MERIRDLAEKLLDERDRRMNVERGERTDLKAYADPLGITQTGDVVALLQERPFQEIEQQRQQAGLDTPTVRDVRNWLDPQRTRGLPREVEDVLVTLYASWSGRTFRRDGRAYPVGRPGQLADEAELLRPELPTLPQWDAALGRAGDLFGIAIGTRALSARNLASFAENVKTAAAAGRDVVELPSALEGRVKEWARPDDAPRVETARATATLLGQLARSDGAQLVRDLADFTPRTSIAAMGRSITTAAANRRLLQEEPRWIVLGQVRDLLGDAGRGERARILLDDLAKLLAADEVNAMLADGLGKLTERAAELLRKPPEPRPPDPTEVVALKEAKDFTDGRTASLALRALADKLEKEGHSVNRVAIQVTAWKRRPE
jgi:hypothetical protein